MSMAFICAAIHLMYLINSGYAMDPSREKSSEMFHGHSEGTSQYEADPYGYSMVENFLRIPRERSGYVHSRKRGNKQKVNLTIEERGQLFYNRGGKVNPAYQGTYWTHEKFFERIYNALCNKAMRIYGPDFNMELVRIPFLERVQKYHYHDTLMKGVERLKREHGLVLSLEEMDMVRKHFLNQKPAEGDTKEERHRILSLKGQYRRDLCEPLADKEAIYRSMAAHGWTVDDIKPYVLPPYCVVKGFLDQLRANRGTATSHSITSTPPNPSLGRSNREIDFDLNDVDNTTTDDITIKDFQLDGRSVPQQEEQDDEDDGQYNGPYYNPYPGAYGGKFYRAYPGTYDSVYGDTSEEKISN